MSPRSRIVRWIRYGLLYAALPLLLFASIETLHRVTVGQLLPRSIGAAVGIATLYILSHILRAIRLALLSTSAYGVSARSTALLHLYTAPISLVLPLKLGELYRLQQLSALTGDPAGAVLIILLDRVLDVAVLLPAFAILILLSPLSLAGAMMITLPLFVILVAAAVVSFAGPPTLKSLQRYVFLRHGRPRARRLLAVLVRAGAVVEHCASSLRTHLVPLLSLSLAIWLLELTVSWLFVRSFFNAGGRLAAAFDVFNRTMVGWNSALNHAAAFQPTVTILGFLCLLLIWPFIAIWYIRRIQETWAKTPERNSRPAVVTKIHLPRYRHGVG